MKKFSFLFINDNVAKTGRTLHLSSFFLKILFLFCLISLLFFIIFLYGFSQYAFNRISYAKEIVNQKNLHGELLFITKMVQESEHRIHTLFCFDDNVRILYGIKAVPKDIREVGIGGPEFISPEQTAERLLSIGREKEVTDLKLRLEKELRQTQLENSSLIEINREINHIKQRLRHFPSVLPTFGRLSSNFGHRSDPITGQPTYHCGLDIANRIWTPVYATADGVIKMVDSNREGFGNLIILNHGYGFSTYYGHLQDFAVKKDQFVMRGDLIGYIGSSGRTTGPHLHYEIRRNNTPIDPLECVHPMAMGLE
ncbi:MAG: hypothetical protein A2293_12030 [Elusimicrobia bacterium RIFOXYB2_FULL_49_7]|nr:MAG: hypothetical protein A2293_12030 [Elusimicrobia bacterium RIFOXYB2_FULL_49_7]